MRSALLKLFRQSPFPLLLKHAEVVREVAPVFRSAVIAYLDGDMGDFEKYHNQTIMLESQGDSIKRNLRGHLPRGVLLPMDKFKLFAYIREQDKVLDSVQNVLHWLSYHNTKVPDPIVDDLLLLVDRSLYSLKAVHPMVSAAESYFDSFSEEMRQVVKESIAQIREYEFQSDQVERKLLADLFAYPFENPIEAFHLIRTVELLGDISNHAENAADMMRAMIAR
ncbi:MAG: TIGR00153 family protein [Deltaproteobacteria bacterium]|nr:TIGR00153 family protein [Deltaproteobacteria bacterium]MBW2068179.1 TIGR00153 family protein [Deltaproteobacteria bacterium]